MEEEKQTIEQPTEEVAEPKGMLEEMVQAGVHFGHSTSKAHPRMRPYITGTRNNVHVIDLEKTKENLDSTISYMTKLIEDGKVILFVGTKIQVKGSISEISQALGQPYVTERWIGGTLTNFEIISKRVEHLKELERMRDEGELEKYTKKEQLDIEEDIARLEMKFGGIKHMTKMPDAIFIADLEENDAALREARRVGIPAIALVDTNNDPDGVDHPIPANNDALSAVRYVMGHIQTSLKKKNG